MDNKRVGSFIKELREEAGISQSALAKKVFIASTVVSRWESGKAGVSASNLVLLSEIFHVSLDELVAGHRFDKESKQEEQEGVLVEVLNSHQKKVRYIKRLLHLIIVLLIIFLGYFFYTFYNSVNVYTIRMDNDKYGIKYGMLTKTRDRIYFHLDFYSNTDVDVDDIENVSIYYNLDNNRKDIIKSDTLTSFNFIDYYGYEEYISFSNFDKIIENMYLEVIYNDSNVERYKLNFKRNYANLDFFLRKERKIDNNADDINSDINISDINDKIEKVKEILKDNNDMMKLKYKNVYYEIIVGSNCVKVLFIEGGVKRQFIYYFGKIVYFYFEKYVDGEWKYEYLKSLDNDKCVEGKCEEFNNHFKLFVDILDHIIKRNK